MLDSSTYPGVSLFAGDRPIGCITSWEPSRARASMPVLAGLPASYYVPGRQTYTVSILRVKFYGRLAKTSPHPSLRARPRRARVTKGRR